MLSLRSAPGPKPSSPGQGAGAFSESSTEVKERLFFEIFALASFPGSQLSKVGLGPPLGRRGLSPLKPAGPQFVPGQTSYSGQLGQTCSRPRKTLFSLASLTALDPARPLIRPPGPRLKICGPALGEKPAGLPGS